MGPLTETSCVTAMELRVKGLLVSHASTPQCQQQWVAAVAGVYCQINTQQGASKSILVDCAPT